MYRVFDLAPGRYRVCVAVAGQFVGARAGGPRSPGKEFARTCHPAAIVEADASDLTLAARDLSGVDIRIQLTGERAISGTVTDAAGRPVDHAFVSADPYDRTATSNSSLSAGGAFTIRSLAPGRYRVSASIGENWAGDSSRPGSERQAGEADADLAVLETATVAIALAKAVTVTGTVRFDGTAPRNLRMTVETRTTRQGRMRFDDRSEAVVKDDLSFELVSLYHRPLFVVTRGLPQGWGLESVRLGGRDITAVPTDFVAAGGGRLEIVLDEPRRVAVGGTRRRPRRADAGVGR